MNNELLEKASQIRNMVERLNRYRYEYYVENNPSISDGVYDHLFDELARLEEETGIYLSNSPTPERWLPMRQLSEESHTSHTATLVRQDQADTGADEFSEEKNCAPYAEVGRTDH